MTDEVQNHMEDIAFAPDLSKSTETPTIEEHREYNSPEVMQKRQQTCFNCQYYTAEEMKCSECNCPVIMLSQFNFKKCPKGYWE